MLDNVLYKLFSKTSERVINRLKYENSDYKQIPKVNSIIK